MNRSLNFTSTGYESYNKEFTLKKFQSAVATTSDTAPGQDNIHYKMIKALPEDMHKHVLKLYNWLWNVSVFPDRWPF